MIISDPIPRFAVHWIDVDGNYYSSPGYFAHEDAEVYFDELTHDRDTLSAELVEIEGGADVVLREWQSAASHAT